MKVLISGSTGLIGSALIPYLESKGITGTRLSRRGPDIAWNPETGKLETSALEGFDAVVHLAGENIASGRWTAEQKQRIRDSRVKGTRLLAESLARLQDPPKSLICASAVGYYGNRGDEVLREDSLSGSGFLAETCREWEAAAGAAAAKGIRVVHLRFGVVLSARGGALAKMLMPFKLGVGGKIGSGHQYMSWVALDDAVSIIHHALITPTLQGPVNAVAPDAPTNATYTQTLGRVLARPTVLPMPAFAAKLAFGEMADELLLASQRVEPRALHKSGYAFRYPNLEGALRHVLSNN
jgi:uncharacterized protein (TIGR01777 family)